MAILPLSARQAFASWSRRPRPRRRPRRWAVEVLEGRLAPAVAGTLSIVGTSLTYAGTGLSNSVQVRTSANNVLEIRDTAGTITTGVAGFTGSGTNTVTGTIPGYVGAVVLNGNAGTDTVTTSGIINIGKGLTVTAESIRLGHDVNTFLSTGIGGSVTLNGSVLVTAPVTVSTFAAVDGNVVINGGVTATAMLGVDAGIRGAVSVGGPQSLSGLSVKAGSLALGATTSSGNVSLNVDNAITLNGNLTANGILVLQANQDGAGGEGFTQVSGNISARSLIFRVNRATGGTGGAAVRGITVLGGAVTLDVSGAGAGGGAIVDNNGTALNVTASTLTAASATGISLDTQVSTIASASATATGGISLRNSGAGLTVISATTADGAISISSAGKPLAVETITAGGSGRDVTLTTTGGGDVTIGSAAVDGTVSAADDAVTITSAGAIVEFDATETNTLITAATVNLTAQGAGGIGGTGPGLELEIDASTLTATSGAGINLLDTDASATGNGLVLASAHGDGEVRITSSSSLTASGNVVSANGDVSLFTNDLGTTNDLAINATISGLNVMLSAQGDLVLDATTGVVVATAGDVTFNGSSTLPVAELSLLGTIAAPSGNVFINLLAAENNVTVRPTSDASVGGAFNVFGVGGGQIDHLVVQAPAVGSCSIMYTTAVDGMVVFSDPAYQAILFFDCETVSC